MHTTYTASLDEARQTRDAAMKTYRDMATAFFRHKKITLAEHLAAREARDAAQLEYEEATQRAARPAAAQTQTVFAY